MIVYESTKGCYVYYEDKALAEYLKQRIQDSNEMNYRELRVAEE